MIRICKEVFFFGLCMICLIPTLVSAEQSSWSTPSLPSQQSSSSVWIHLTTECMLNGSCSFSIYDALDIRKEGRAPEQRTSVMVFIQDIILGASYFIGTVVTASLIVSGLFYVLSPTDSGYQQKASKGIKYSLIGLVVVTLALVIIRLVQFLAKWGI